MPVDTGSLRLSAPGLKFLGPKPEGEESFSALKGRFATWFSSSLEPEKTGFSPSDGFSAWPHSVQDKARSQYGKKLEEILSLLSESDEEIFISSWTNFASREEGAGREDRAAALYAMLGEHPAGATARNRLAVLQGQGNFGLKAERLMRNFNQQAFDPSMLGGMMVATSVFSGLRLVGMTRLLNAEASILTRGRGARVLASAFGMAGEVPAFLFSSKGLAEAMGRSQDWRAQSLVHEGAALGISLLYLKSLGALGQKGAAWSGAPVARRLLPDASALAGLYLGRQTEAALGLRPEVDRETAMTESLVFLLQLKVGGDVSHRLMGRTWREAIQAIQWKAANSAPPVARPHLPLALPAEAALSPSQEGLPKKPAQKGPELSFMVGGDKPRFSPTFTRDAMKVMLEQNFSPPPEASAELKQNYPEILARIVDNIHNSRFDPVSYHEKFNNSRIKDVVNDRQEMTSRIEILDYATTYWRNVQEMNPLRRASGCLYDHLMQEALERTFREGERQDWDALIKVAGWDRRIRHLDVFFQERGWDQRYAFQDKPESGTFARLKRDAVSWYRAKVQKLEPARETYAAEVQGLSLSAEAKLAVTRYLDSFIHGEQAKAFLASEHNYILLKPLKGPERREKLTPELAVAALENFIKSSGPNSRRLSVLEDAIQKAAQSGTPLLQFDRLFKILATGNLSPKLAEIASGEPFHWGKLLGILKLSAGEADWRSAGDHIAGSVFTGYVFDPILAEKFARFYDKVSLLQQPHEQELRRTQFHAHAHRVLRHSPNREFGTEEVLELLNLRGTPISRLAREKILDGEVDLKVVSPAEAQKIFDSLRNNENRGKPVPVAFYAPAIKNPDGVPLIVVQRQNPKLSPGQKVADAASLAAIVVHEFQHYLDSQTHSYFEPMERLRSEMRAWLEEIAFMVENGVMHEWNKVEPQSPYGFGVHLRNLIDKDYIEGPRDLVVSPEK